MPGQMEGAARDQGNPEGNHDNPSDKLLDSHANLPCVCWRIKPQAAQTHVTRKGCKVISVPLTT